MGFEVEICVANLIIDTLGAYYCKTKGNLIVNMTIES